MTKPDITPEAVERLLAEIERDREAGTPGPWDWEGGDGPENIYAKANLGVWSESLLQDALDDDSYDEPDDEKWVCGIWGDIDNRQCTDARRIARVPEMEEVIIAQAERIAELEASNLRLDILNGNYHRDMLAFDKYAKTSRNNALRDVENAADKLGYHCINCGHLCENPEKDLGLIRRSGAKSCCPERKMEPLSKPILALIEGDTND